MPTTGTYRVGGTPASVQRKEYTLEDDFDLAVNSGQTKDLDSAAGFEQLYRLDIEEGLGEFFGRGTEENPLQAQGFIGVRFVNDTAAAQAQGRYRFAVRNAQGRRLYNIHEGELASDDLFDGAAGSGTLKDRRDRQPFPVSQSAFETEPHVISLDVNVGSDITVDDAEGETRLSAEGYRAEALR